MVNIYKELNEDLGCYIPNNGYLKEMGRSGCYDVKHSIDCTGTSCEFSQRYWMEEFTDAAIRVLNQQDRPIVFMLWGRPAQSKKALLDNPNHLILEAPHPSPLSAYRGFFGCHHFSQANEFLKEHGLAPIDWQIENI